MTLKFTFELIYTGHCLKLFTTIPSLESNTNKPKVLVVWSNFKSKHLSKATNFLFYFYITIYNIQGEIEIHQNIKTLGSSDELWKSCVFSFAL
jgi:hypothetical protein